VISLLTVLVVLTVWTGVSRLLAGLGGWARLAELYPDRSDLVEGETVSWQSGSVGPVSYNSCLKLQATREGLRLSTHFFFRVGHPPLWIPWDQLHGISRRTVIFRQFLVVDVGRPAVARLALPVWIETYLPNRSVS
jgi:hypothetical protein